MKTNAAIVFLMVISAACQSASPTVPPTPAGQVETKDAASRSAGQTSTAAAALALTAAVPAATSTIAPSPTLVPTTAVLPTDTPVPTSTNEVVIVATAAFPTATQPPINADAIAGTWSGNAHTGDFNFQISVTIGPSCVIGATCGSFDIPALPCSGTFTLIGINDPTYQFQAGNLVGACTPDASDFLRLQSDGTLLYLSRGSFGESTGVLQR
jgi:hypothetical protein